MQRRLLVMGLPGTGKTTFLAALWHVAASGEVNGSLQLEKVSGDAKHLNEVKNDWLLCKPLQRTILGSEQTVSLWLKDAANRVSAEVQFPDLSGESFRIQWKDRRWTVAYAKLVEECTSVLLFIHPGKVTEPQTIADLQRLVAATVPGENEQSAPEAPSSGDAKNSEPTPDWSPDLAPTQVQLVGLLQFLDPHLAPNRERRIAVVISAWDLVKTALQEGCPPPEEWLRQRLPYLWQYLRTQQGGGPYRVYGVSAQGGDLETDRDRLHDFEKAAERIVVDGPDCLAYDITEPVRWGLGWARAASANQ